MNERFDKANNVQNIVGKKSEKDLANFLQTMGYWAYNCPKTVNGQPCDIIACKDNKVWLLDSKHLEKNKASFSIERIEPNQWTAMDYARELANVQNLGFAIYWERTGDFYFLSYDDALKAHSGNEKSIKIESLLTLWEEISK